MLHRRHLHRVSLLSGDGSAGDLDLVANVGIQVSCRLRNIDRLWPSVEVRELERVGVGALRQAPGHAVLSRRALLSLGAKSKPKRARKYNRRHNNGCFHCDPFSCQKFPVWIPTLVNSLPLPPWGVKLRVASGGAAPRDTGWVTGKGEPYRHGEIGDGSSGSRYVLVGRLRRAGFSEDEIAAIVCSRRWYNRYSRRVKPLVAVRLDVARLLGKMA